MFCFFGENYDATGKMNFNSLHVNRLELNYVQSSYNKHKEIMM